LGGKLSDLAGRSVSILKVFARFRAGFEVRLSSSQDWLSVLRRPSIHLSLRQQMGTSLIVR